MIKRQKGQCFIYDALPLFNIIYLTIKMLTLLFKPSTDR